MVMVALLSMATVFAQDDDFDGPPPREKMMQKIEDLRKMKLLDLLNLQGDQVEKFFSVYNRSQGAVISAKKDLDRKAVDLREATESGADESVLKGKTDAVLAAMKSFEEAINKRHADVKSLLSVRQYATYIAFEARFQEELTRLIMQRARKPR
jgi:Spy/CpxP family protein refolding chaperone